MKTYVLTTGVVFGLLAAAHVWRIFGENARLAGDPFFVTITLIAAGLCAWAGWLLWRERRAAAQR